jgi:hypothetical protein
VEEFTIDLIQPDAGTPAADFLATYGEGLYQVFLHVASIEHAQNLLAEHKIGLTGYGDPAAPWAIPSAQALGAHLVLVGSA